MSSDSLNKRKVPRRLGTTNVSSTNATLLFALVATPSLNDGSYDISSVWNVVEDFKKSEAKLNGKTLVIGCTTNPGDCEKFSEELAYFGVGVVYNPEFIAQGTIVRDLQNADMVLIGG